MSELKGAGVNGQSGGPTSVINSSVLGALEAALDNPSITRVFGMAHGIKGLLNDDLYDIDKEDRDELALLRYTPSSALGSCRYKLADPDVDDTDYKRILEVFKKHDVRYFFYNGGNDSMDTCNKISKYMQKVGYECRVMGVPKTIDNDLWGTELTFGFQSAIDIASTVIDSIHSTAFSHSRVFIVEVMGHKAGWLTLYAGIASGADVIVIPEIPYSAKKIAAAIEKRAKAGKRFSIIAVAEGAISQDEAKLSKKEFKAAREVMTYPSISYRIADELKELTGQEIRVTIPGHYQRGGAPCPADRVLTSRFGVAAAQLILQKKFGYMVALQDNHIVPVPLTEVAGKLKTVPPDGELVKQARALGLSMGD